MRTSHYLFSLCLSLISALTFSQNNELIEAYDIREEPAKVEKNKIFEIVEQQAEFPGGGIGAMLNYIKTEFIYPKKSIEDKDQGVVYVQFVVERNGKITNIRIRRGLTDELDLEAIRVVKSMPKWKPAEVKNKTVRSRFTIPVKCILPKS